MRTTDGAARGREKLTAAGAAALISKAQAAAKASGTIKPAKYADGAGLHLFINERAKAYWRVKFRLRRNGKLVERLTSLGPAVGDGAISLKQARESLTAIKAELALGQDPVQQKLIRHSRQTITSESTFDALLADWIAINKQGDKETDGWAPGYAEKVEALMDRDVLPEIGALPVTAVEPQHITNVVNRLVKRGAKVSAARLRRQLASVFKLAMGRGLIERNPAEVAALELGIRGKRTKRKSTAKAASNRRPALTDFIALGDLLRKAERTTLAPVTRIANDLLIATLVRMEELTSARWDEFILEGPEPRWTIPRARMKDKHHKEHDHVVPLPPGLAQRLKDWRSYNEESPFVLPGNAKDDTISDATLRHAYRRALGMSGKHCPHGWRASFSTLAHEAEFDSDAIEAQLDHAIGNAVKRAYDRGVRWEQRVPLMKWWWASLEQAKAGAKVIPITGGARAA